MGKRHKPEEIVARLRRADVLTAQAVRSRTRSSKLA